MYKIEECPIRKGNLQENNRKISLTKCHSESYRLQKPVNQRNFKHFWGPDAIGIKV